MKGLSADLFLTLDWDMLYNPVVDGELFTDVPINLLDDVNSEANLFFQSIFTMSILSWNGSGDLP
jgi:hypothetical protein